ncbi:hypothetical protein OAP14_02010 [Aliiglaciecola sp.]|nr:hypothetical protein [Aliiglaciecola sp.]
MKKKVVLHIGPHKTASTYIQKMLHKNRKALQSCGWTYPTVGVVGYGQHRFAELLFNKDYEGAMFLWKEMSKGHHNIVVSSENFDRLDEEDIKALKSLLNDCEVEIIYFYRRNDDRLISSWQESIKHGGTLSWQHYLLNSVVRPYRSESLNDSLVVSYYTKEFNINVKIVDYDIAVDAGVDLFESFLMFFGLKKRESKGFVLENKKINVASDYAVIEILRILNLIDIELGNKPFHFLRERFFNCLANELDIEDIKNDIDLVDFRLNDSLVLEHINATFMSSFSDKIVNYSDSKKNGIKVYKLPIIGNYSAGTIHEKIRELYYKVCE